MILTCFALVLKACTNIVNISQAQNYVKMEGTFRSQTLAFFVGLIIDVK